MVSEYTCTQHWSCFHREWHWHYFPYSEFIFPKFIVRLLGIKGTNTNSSYWNTNIAKQTIPVPLLKCLLMPSGQYYFLPSYSSTLACYTFSLFCCIPLTSINYRESPSFTITWPIRHLSNTQLTNYLVPTSPNLSLASKLEMQTLFRTAILHEARTSNRGSKFFCYNFKRSEFILVNFTPLPAWK